MTTDAMLVSNPWDATPIATVGAADATMLDCTTNAIESINAHYRRAILSQFDVAG